MMKQLKRYHWTRCSVGFFLIISFILLVNNLNTFETQTLVLMRKYVNYNCLYISTFVSCCTTLKRIFNTQFVSKIVQFSRKNKNTFNFVVIIKGREHNLSIIFHSNILFSHLSLILSFTIFI